MHKDISEEMKWFKHLVDSGDDPDIGRIMEKFGIEGYYFFFRTIEIMAREFKVEHPGENTFGLRWFCSRFYGYSTLSLRQEYTFKDRLLRFLSLCSKLKRIKFKILDDGLIWLKCMKLKDLCDEYTLKLLKQMSEPCRDNVPTTSGQTPEQEEEIRSKKKNKKINKKIYISLWNEFAEKNKLAPIITIDSNSNRGRNLKARLRSGMDLESLLKKIEDQPFLLGDNKDGWVVTFDWIIKASNYQKIIEGQYKSRERKAGEKSKAWAERKQKELDEQESPFK